jgi:transcriptional regulator with XRE-family HTH domain
MIHRKHLEEARFVLARLEDRKRSLKLSDTDLFLKSGVARSTFGKWRSGERRSHFASVLAAADALGMKFVLIDKP